MKSELHQLKNNEAILLMYLADELPPQDRAEVEQMLASDAVLARDLENLRQLQEQAFSSLQALDAATRPVVSEALAQRQVSALIRDWADRQAAGHPEPAMAIHRPIPWRRVGFAAAAGVLVGYYIWAVYQPMKMPQSQGGDTQAQIDQFGLPAVADTPAPPRELTDQEKLAQLASSLQDSISDDSSNLHVAEVAAAVPNNSDADQNETGEP